MQMNTLTLLFLSKFVTEKIFRKIQITIMLSIPDKAKGNVKRYICRVMFEHCRTFHPKPNNTDGLKKVLLLPRLIEECKSLPPSVFISQQDDAPANVA